MTADPSAALAAIRARVEAATPGPGPGTWVADHMNVIATRAGWWSPIRYDGHRVDADAEFIAHARDDVPFLLAEVQRRDDALDAVLALHQPEDVPSSEHYYCDPDECNRAGEGGLVPRCQTCELVHPCPTHLAAIAAHLAPADTPTTEEDR